MQAARIWLAGQRFFFVEGKAVVVFGDVIAPHGVVPHANPTMIEGSGWMTLNGIPRMPPRPSRQLHPFKQWP